MYSHELCVQSHQPEHSDLHSCEVMVPDFSISLHILQVNLLSNAESSIMLPSGLFLTILLPSSLSMKSFAQPLAFSLTRSARGISSNRLRAEVSHVMEIALLLCTTASILQFASSTSLL